MMTDNEKAKVKEMRDAFLDSVVEVCGENVDPELHAEFVGRSMAMIDALFAIREGEAWRGMTDPKDIARALLRLSEIGE